MAAKKTLGARSYHQSDMLEQESKDWARMAGVMAKRAAASMSR